LQVNVRWPNMAFEWAPPALTHPGALTFRAECLLPEASVEAESAPQPSSERQQQKEVSCPDEPTFPVLPWGASHLPRWSGILQELEADLLPEMPLAPPEIDVESEVVSTSSGPVSQENESNVKSKPFEARFEPLKLEEGFLLKEPSTPCSTRSTSGSIVWQPDVELGSFVLKRTHTTESLASSSSKTGSLIVEKAPSVAPRVTRRLPSKTKVQSKDYATKAEVDAVCRRAEQLLKSMTAVVKSNERVSARRRIHNVSCPPGSLPRRNSADDVRIKRSVQPLLRRAQTSS